MGYKEKEFTRNPTPCLQCPSQTPRSQIFQMSWLSPGAQLSYFNVFCMQHHKKGVLKSCEKHIDNKLILKLIAQNVATHPGLFLHSLPWMNSEIRKEMNKRYKLLKACDGTPSTNNLWADYKSSRNKVSKMLRCAEAQYWKKKFTETKDS